MTVIGTCGLPAPPERRKSARGLVGVTTQDRAHRRTEIGPDPSPSTTHPQDCMVISGLRLQEPKGVTRSKREFLAKLGSTRAREARALQVFEASDAYSCSEQRTMKPTLGPAPSPPSVKHTSDLSSPSPLRTPRPDSSHENREAR